MKRAYRILLPLMFLILAISCKKKEEIVTENGTELVITIKDEDSEVILDEIDVYLYKSFSDYQSAVYNETPTNYDYTVKSNAFGVATFSGVDAGIQYFIYINYTGKSYTLNNYFSYNQLPSDLVDNATTSIVVELTPFNVGRVAFWTQETNLQNLDINIWIEDSLIGTLPGVISGSPSTVNEDQTLLVPYQSAGTFVWQAKGDNGCYWSGEVNLVNDETKYIELTQCSTGSVVVWAKENIFSQYNTLSVFVNENDYVSDLTTGLTNAPQSCQESTNSSAVIERPYGTYNYKVTSSSEECVWIGTFTISEQCSGDIELGSCN